jgi:hypothetical protein
MPACFPSCDPFHHDSSALLASKSTVHPAFFRKSASPPHSVCSAFPDPDAPDAQPPPPQPTFSDFFTSLQKFRQQLGGGKCAPVVPQMKRFTGECQ